MLTSFLNASNVEFDRASFSISLQPKILNTPKFLFFCINIITREPKNRTKNKPKIGH